MCIQLTIDEMLEILDHEGSPMYPGMKDRAEEFAYALAVMVQVAEPRLKWQGTVHRERLDFGGTCAQFGPREAGPVPACLLNTGIEVQEWIDLCDDLNQTRSHPDQ